jgi:hypothetical protein
MRGFGDRKIFSLIACAPCVQCRTTFAAPVSGEKYAINAPDKLSACTVLMQIKALCTARFLRD